MTAQRLALEQGDPAQGARLLLGAPVAAGIRARVKAEVTAFRNRQGVAPTLAVVVVGKDAPSAVYLQQIIRSCRNVGVSGRLVELTGRASTEELREQIRQLNEDPLVSGIIVQMPLPRRIPLRTVIDTIDPRKDVDGIHPFNTGLMLLGYEGFTPATARATVEILHRYGYRLEGLRAVVIGRSNIVGKPVAQLLLREHCTVTICHRRTRDLAKRIGEAEVLVVAAGHPGLVRGEMLRPGSLVVDVGVNVVPSGIVGDVDFPSARKVAAAITPVPGGLGPVTNAILLQQVMRAARDLARGPERRGLRTATRRSLRRAGAH
ncbi:MAG: bifunctional 5,10-methylenetetrahydrofolate dehydrogenase/5,10-methenyltetrahydrofolate cyclohydrolase [Chloroflexota bacterium]|nr:bifunctional 5,10-methylenetetrahydrofolate dehydrogenase/5,10-methenyltetrahydrofolate cyclohydrolase [Chloroflexota bacterium]